MKLLSGITNGLKIISELSKVKITIAVSFTTFTGYVLAKGKIDTGFILATLGIFLLACGSSVINHIQERNTDSKMERTKSRPLPSHKISVTGASVLAIIQILAGSYFLYAGSNLTGLFLAWLALIWYNAVYTFLKKITFHAVIPGSLIGSIPPLVGWVAGGGDIFTIKALATAAFFFIWQIPHFYLLMYKFRKDYAAAGFPEISSVYQVRNFKRFIFIWICLMALSSFVFPLLSITNSPITFIGLILFAIIILSIFLGLMSKKEEFSAGKYFMRINYYVLGVVCLLVLDHFFPLHIS